MPSRAIWTALWGTVTALGNYGVGVGVPQQQPLVVTGNHTAYTDLQGCQLACDSLAAASGKDLITHQDAIPISFTESYYSHQQRGLRPLCVAQPLTAESVALVVRTVREHRCPFAVKSGGHSNAPGTNVRDGGLVLDLQHLDGITVSEDESTVSLGPGNRWGRVYRALQPLGLVVVGGRADGVGVGGFMVGGGISFLSRRYGWAVDNVRNFEVVLPNGTLANANPQSHPDIYHALRGGGSSFGIVTRFDLVARRHAAFHGGTEANVVADLVRQKHEHGLHDPWEWSVHAAACAAVRWLQHAYVYFGGGFEYAALIRGLAQQADAEDDDATGAHAFIFTSWIPKHCMFAAGAAYVYSGEAEEVPPSLQGLSSLPHMSSTRRNGNLSTFTAEVDELTPSEQRQHWRTASSKFRPELVETFFKAFYREANVLRKQVPDALISINVQVLTKAEVAKSQGDNNAFGLKVEDAPLCFYTMTISYDHAKDDTATRLVSERIFTHTLAASAAAGAAHPFIYPNYAAVGQDVFAGFAPESLKRLLEIQSRYDPGRVFANLQPGHLTLNDEKVEGWGL